jgi:RNA polymerase primary sigma factor
LNAVASYLYDIGKYKRLSYEEEKELSKLINDKEKNEDAIIAREKMIESNYRLVVHVGKNYQNFGLSFMDIIQEGNLGLIHAVDKYDETRGTRFSTFAIPIIKQKILRAISNQARVIRIPEYKITQMRKLKKEILNIGDEEVNEETLAKLNINYQEYIEMIQLINTRVLSLDSKVMNDSYNNISLIDICKSKEKNPHENYIDNIHVLQDELLTILTKNEREVVELRWGIIDGKKKTYLEIAKLMRMSPKKIKKTDIDSILKMRDKYYSRF